MTALPKDVAALLAAVVEALDIPLPGLTDADERAHNALLRWRADAAVVALQCVLDNGHNPARRAATLRQHTTDNPVTYTPYEPTEQRSGGEGR